MGLRDFTKSGAFVAAVFALVVVLVPFGLEQIGEATDLFSFPVSKTVRGWFVRPAAAGGSDAVKPVDWERYRHDLASFTEWAEGRRVVLVSRPPVVDDVIRLPTEEKHRRQIWRVPVTSCTAGNPMTGRKGYVFISGFDRRFVEGDMISPTADLCGYEIVFVGDRAVWFRAVFDSDGDKPVGHLKLPELNRLGDECLVIDARKYVARDAFPLESGGWLTIDDFLPPDGVLFKLRDERRDVVASILCIVISEKGGR